MGDFHVDIGHTDIHIDIPIHVDVPPPHIDFGHIDIPTPHVDIPPPHIDAAPVHIDIPTPHIDLPPPHIDLRPIHIDLHSDVPVPHHLDVPPPPHVDANPAHVDIGYNHWWQNWPKTHRYIPARTLFPTTVDDVVSGVKQAESDRMPLRAVGGGWSFSDAALPGNVAPSLAVRPASDRPNVENSNLISKLVPLAQGFPADDQPSVASIDANNDWLIGYEPDNTRLLGGAMRNVPQLMGLLTPPQPQPAYLMNTRGMKSSLQAELKDILSPAALTATAPGPHQKHYFHVEAGISMDELAHLLDSHHPRVELQASGGNRGATLAGALSTATHGSEFRISLLTDRVKAVHLVGPGGQQWWIEGTDSIVNRTKLHNRYPALDHEHVIAGHTRFNNLLPQDWLNAVAVSAGCMGVIYSVVLEVFPLKGSQMVTSQTSWFKFLDAVRAQNASLAALNTQQMLQALRDPTDHNAAALNLAIGKALTDGPNFSRGLISSAKNTHGEMAFNPNPAPASSHALMATDQDCWVVYRQDVPIPIDAQPPGGGGIGAIADAVAREMKKEFGIDADPANLSGLVLRLADVYGLSHPFHIDIPSPHIDLPSVRIEMTPHIDVPAPHIDIAPLHIDATQHIDLGHVDVHVDIRDPFHIDVPSPHIDVPPIHIGVGPLHVDIPGPHIDVGPLHIDMPVHIDLGHIDVNPALEDIARAVVNPFVNVLSGLFGGAPVAAPILRQLILSGVDLNPLVGIVSKIVSAQDTLDVALGALTAPIASAGAVDLARPFLTGFLASTMGTANDAGFGISIGTSVGAVGFPDGGMLGAAIEIGLPLETGFSFLQSKVLDRMDPTKPFFGYISVRLCPQTVTLLGHQQWQPISMMIEVVSFGDAWGRQFMAQLQADTLAYMASGKDAMLHLGLENDQMTARHLSAVPALQRQAVTQGSSVALTKLAAFKLVRSLLFSNGGVNAGLFPVFNNSFTSRLQFD